AIEHLQLPVRELRDHHVEAVRAQIDGGDRYRRADGQGGGGGHARKLRCSILVARASLNDASCRALATCCSSCSPCSRSPTPIAPSPRASSRATAGSWCTRRKPPPSLRFWSPCRS